MIIRYISLLIEHGTIPEEERTRFHINVNFTINYLSRAIRRKRIATDNSYNFIGVRLCREKKADKASNLFKSIIVYEQLTDADWNDYLHSKSVEQRTEFILKWLETGYYRAAQIKSIPVDTLLSVHEEFRKNDYRNEWLFKKKTIIEFGISVYLKCYLTFFDFRLELEAINKQSGTLVCKGTLFQSPPLEEWYNHLLHEIRITESILEILDSSGFANITVDISRLASGEFNYQYHDNERYKGEVWNKGWKKEIIENQRMIDKMTW